MTAHRQTSRQPTSRDRALQGDGNRPEWRGEYSAPTPDTDVAYAAGAEAMREACAIAAYTIPAYVRGLATDTDGLLFPGSVYDQGRYDARKAIEALPLPPAPEPTP